MSATHQFDIGSYVRTRLALANTALDQTSAAAATTENGVTMDRQESGLSHYYSAKAVVSGAFASNSSLANATLSINVEHSSDGTSWDSFSTGTKPTAVEWGSTAGSTATTGGTEYDTVEQKVNLLTARRYVRVTLDAPTYSDSSSGTELNVHGVWVFGGPDELPAA